VLSGESVALIAHVVLYPLLLPFAICYSLRQEYYSAEHHPFNAHRESPGVTWFTLTQRTVCPDADIDSVAVYLIKFVF
jgi:hypothetical protein